MSFTRAVAGLCLWAGFAGAADAPVTLEVTGEAPIIDGNRQRAQEVAKDAALRTAVERVAGTVVSATTLTQNSQLISDEILSHSAGYVSHWEPVGKPTEEGGVLKVTVKATVSKADLDKDLAAVQALITRLGNRKLVILTQEQTIQVPDKEGKSLTHSSSVLSTVLSEVFKQDGWTLVDPQFAAGKVRLGAAVGQAEAKEIGELSKADYILYGTAAYREQLVDSMLAGAKVFPVTGEYTLTLFAADSGTQIAQLSGKFGLRQGEKGVSPLLSYERTAFDLTKLRGAEIANDIRGKVVEYLRSARQNGNRVVMNVVGLADYAAVQNFKKVLSESVTGVLKVNPGSFGKGKAEFDVTFAGSTDDLAERLGGKAIKGKKVTITGVTGNTIEVTIGK